MADCVETCNATLDYCLQQGGDHVQAVHIKAMIDCIEACTLATAFHARKSALVDSAMEFCAKACKACEESCEEFGNDATMKRCADTCRACYEHCTS